MYLDRQDIRAGAGHRIICGFDGTTLTPELKDLLREVRPLGLILFARNIPSAAEVAEFNRELKAFRRDEPLLLCVDQEGGRVARVKAPATLWPPMRTLGERDDPKLAQQLGAALAREMRALNFDVDFAPVLDVDTNPQNPIIGDRAIASHPSVVARLGAAFVRGMQGAGVAACAKHFPGHGDTDVDSHLSLPTVDHGLSRLRDTEWPPFAASIAAGVSSIMTAHVVVQAIDATRPATLSHACLQKHLRQELKFEGIIVSDDIEMKALADNFGPAEIGEQGLAAGIDVFLACHAPTTTLALYRSLVHAAEAQLVRGESWHATGHRLARWREQYYRPPVGVEAFAQTVGCAKHAALAHALQHPLQS